MGSDGCYQLFQEEFGEGFGDFITCPDLFSGGGLYLAEGVEAEISGGSVIRDNVVCHVNDPCDGSISIAGNDGTGYSGGGIASKHPLTILIVDSTIDSNHVTGHDPGTGRNVRATGGGLSVECFGENDPQNPGPPCLEIIRSTVSRNEAYLEAQVEGQQVITAFGAGIAMAGGVADEEDRRYPPVVNVVNSTIADNLLTTLFTSNSSTACNTSPTSEEFPAAPFGFCRTQAGAIWYKWLIVNIRHTSIIGNTAILDTGSEAGELYSGGIFASNQQVGHPATKLVLRSTLMAYNMAHGSPSNIDYYPAGGSAYPIDSENYNLLDDEEPGNWESPAPGDDQFETEVCFHTAGLTNNNGPTETYELAKCDDVTSAAIDAGGPDDHNLGDDQRGEDRVEGNATDVGSFECQSGECQSEGGEPIPPPPGNDLTPDSSGFTNDSDTETERDAAPPVPADMTVPATRRVADASEWVFGRVLPIQTDALALWDDPLLMLGNALPR
jgi:hypothetical protein